MQIEKIIIQIVALLVGITVHEMAHGWTAYRLGDSTARLQGRLSFSPLAHIDPFGTVVLPALLIFMGAPVLGWAKPVPVNPGAFREPKRDMALVSIAGPASNLVVAVISAVLLKTGFLWPSGGGLMYSTIGVGIAAPLYLFLLSCLSINVLLAVFNLIPIPPLDGGHFLEGVLPPDLARQYRRIEPFGMILIFALLFIGLLDRVIVPIHTYIIRIIL